MPCDFFTPTPREEPDTYIGRLQRKFDDIKSTPASAHGSGKFFVHKDLQTTTHVFLRTDSTKRPLQCPYDGPYKVEERNEKTFIINIKGKQKCVSIDRLKPAFVPIEDNVPVSITVPDSPTSTLIRTTRSGRKVHFPVRLEQHRA